MIYLYGPRQKRPIQGGQYINTTSRSKNWTRELSPFFLGPIELYDGHVSRNMENAWQYSKVYPEHADDNGPTEDYWAWAENGWSKGWAERYPMGKGKKPLYSYWDGDHLEYVEARKRIYAPLYARAVEETDAFKKLKELHAAGEDILLWDFDVYDHRKEGRSYAEVINDPKRKCGHGFVLAMMLEEERVWEDA